MHTSSHCLNDPGRKVQLKLRKCDPEGLYYWTAWEFTALTDENSQPSELLCLGNDVTEAVEAEINLVKTVQERDSIPDNITDAFLVVDRGWQVIKLNRAFENILKVKQEDQMGRNLWKLFPDAVHLKFYSEAQRAMQEQIAVHFEEFYPSYNCWFEASVYPSEEGLNVFFRDITEKKPRSWNFRTLSIS
jgi:PAS domain S-box-containing protein